MYNTSKNKERELLMSAMLPMSTGLLLAALLPAIVLLIRVYRLDQIEKEPTGLLLRLLVLGALSAIPASLIEGVLLGLMTRYQYLFEDEMEFLFVENFIVIAVTEELCKRFPVRHRAWNDQAFDYRFDAVVYCVFSALGFAAVENVLYVAQFGLSSAVSRALLSVPGHFFFAVYMGTFLGEAKMLERRGDHAGAKRFRGLSVLVPVILHGFWDFLLSVQSWEMTAIFYLFVIVFFLCANRRLNRAAEEDTEL